VSRCVPVAVACALAAVACDVATPPAAERSGSLAIVFEDRDAALRRHETTIRSTLAETYAKVARLLPVGEVLVTVMPDAARTVERLGVGGHAAGPGNVRIAIDPALVGQPSFPRNLAYTLAHELHHSVRWRRPGFGTTLFETMITEGLADDFCREVLRDDGVAPPWIDAFPRERTGEMLERARPEFDDPDHDRGAWFFGTGTLPRWTGYTLGFRIVEAYRSAHPGVGAAQLVALPADVFAEWMQRADPALRGTATGTPGR
jgi:uncharacterized protein YjaZ